MNILRRAVCIVVVLLAMSSAVESRAQILPEAVITPDTIDFGDVRVGQTSTQQTFTVTKSSQQTLPLLIFAVRLADTTNFSVVTDGCSGEILHTGESCEIVVDFAPSEAGRFQTNITLIDLSRNIIDFAGLAGRGVAPRVILSAASVDFGDQTVNISSSPHEVLVINDGNAALTVADVSVADEFMQTNDCTTPIDPGDACGIDIVFTPTATGVATGQVTITDDAADSPQTIALQGTGIAPGSPDASLSTHALDFGSIVVGTASDPETVILTNVGTVALAITSIVASGDYSQTNDCGLTVAPDGSCVISIVLAPTATGERQGVITITDDATDSPQTVSLTGQGVSTGASSMQLSVTAVDFGDQESGTPSDPKAITVTNVGTADMIGESSVIEGEGAHSFSRLDRCAGTTVPINGTCTIDAVFTPATDGTFTATLTITSDASDSPQTVTLRGVGTGGDVGGGGCQMMPQVMTGANALVVALFCACVGVPLIARRRRG